MQVASLLMTMAAVCCVEGVYRELWETRQVFSSSLYKPDLLCINVWRSTGERKRLESYARELLNLQAKNSRDEEAVVL